MTDPIEFLTTKDGKRAPQEFAIAKDLALPCIRCGRKTKFLKAAFCDLCKVLWFDGVLERVGPAKKIWYNPILPSLSQLELERLTWICEYANKPETKYWNEWIEAKSKDLFDEYIRYTHWTPNATWKKLGTLGV